MKQNLYGNLIQLRRLGAFNSYIVKDSDGLTLIDTNLPGSASQIIEAAQALGESIRRIVITHAHNDHAASLDDIVATLPEIEVIISERETPLLAGNMQLRADEPQSKLRGGYITTKTTPTTTVHDQDMIGSLQVVASPGHTPGHIALFDTRDQTLIAGDAFATQFGTVVAGKMKLLFPFPALATWDKPTALRSAKRLLELNPARLAVGHGPVLENPQPAMQTAIAEAESSFPATTA
jgi:glyoxylase-like metal-dependent hydrolase (beta-lactamase superfamily II)